MSLRNAQTNDDEPEIHMFTATTIRLLCRCAECADLSTGKNKLNLRTLTKVPRPVSVTQKTNFCAKIIWEDDHESVILLTSLDRILKSRHLPSMAALSEEQNAVPPLTTDIEASETMAASVSYDW